MLIITFDISHSSLCILFQKKAPADGATAAHVTLSLSKLQYPGKVIYSYQKDDCSLLIQEIRSGRHSMIVTSYTGFNSLILFIHLPLENLNEISDK